MSYITEIKLKIHLGKNAPKNLIQYLEKWIDTGWCDEPYVNNPFFETDRWSKMLATYGYDAPSLVPVKTQYSIRYELNIHTDINYESGELDAFIEWIKPYVYGRKKRAYIGWLWRDGSCKKENVYINR